MRIGLVSYRCENRNTAFNMSQIELAMKRSEGKVENLDCSVRDLPGSRIH